METIPYNFMGLEQKYSNYDNSRFVVIPIPYDRGTSWRAGARNGPAAIIAASQHMEWFDEELEAECYKCGITTLDAIEPNVDSSAAMQEELFKMTRRVVRDGKFPFALGGDHSITAALVRAAMTKHKKLSILQIDAHCDMRDSYQGSRQSHAAAMRRVVELGASVVPVGVRAVSPEGYRFMRRRKIKPITARECHMEDGWVDRVLDTLGERVYVTIDIDGFDPAFAPGTGTPEPGGLDWYQVTGLLRIVACQKNVVGADIVEVAPIPGQVVTEFLAARLAYKLICYLQMKP